MIFHREVAEVEYVAYNPDGPKIEWFGGGVMISNPKVPGHNFNPATHIDEYDLRAP